MSDVPENILIGKHRSVRDLIDEWRRGQEEIRHMDRLTREVFGWGNESCVRVEDRSSESCLNCGKPAPFAGRSFCSSDCARNYSHDRPPVPKGRRKLTKRERAARRKAARPE